MSTSLVKQSLSLFDDDLNQEPAKKKKTKDPMSLISTKKKGVRKELRKLQQEKQRKVPRKTSGLSTYNDYQDPGCFDYTDKSVEILTRLSQLDSANKKAASTISEHHGKKRRRKAAPAKDNKTDEEKSAFSEKDFEAFSKEFDFSKLKKT
ncbi:active regulator of SIRT1-like [Mercenaria mercenaria]|uniref:active regulator of SIRT1-like n=1 Tax=Mercenaria mercenaria TaxID=6596 RepID=UPI001E1D5C24|nr:active regulator of SIRT1-like [Mercenaria mercenaria]